MNNESNTPADVSLRTALTPEERVSCWKTGAALAMAMRGITPSEFDKTVGLDTTNMSKEAKLEGFSRLLSPMAIPKSIAFTSLIAGVPLGVVWHAVDRRAKMNRNKERDMEEQINYYSEAGRQLEASMATRGSL